MASALQVPPPTAPETPSVASAAPLEGANVFYFSAARWDDDVQRTQPLLRRISSIAPVHFWEPPVGGERTRLDVRLDPRGVTVVTPVTDKRDQPYAILDGLLKDYIQAIGAPPIVKWFAAPDMFAFARGAEALCTVYDRIGRGPADPREERLLTAADIVFVDDSPAADEIQARRAGVHAFSPGVSYERFVEARGSTGSTVYESIRKPRAGYCGVIDGRLDLALLDRLAAAKPRWSFPLVGPLSGLSAADLPRRPNIHYLGAPPREDLPAHVAAFTIGLAPIVSTGTDDLDSPTNIGEYLAAGKPVVTTRIAGAERSYDGMPGVFMAENDRWLDACACALALSRRKSWLKDVDHRLAAASWDRIASTMLHKIASAALAKRRAEEPAESAKATARRRWRRSQPAPLHTAM